MNVNDDKNPPKKLNIYLKSVVFINISGTAARIRGHRCLQPAVMNEIVDAHKAEGKKTKQRKIARLERLYKPPERRSLHLT